MTTSTMRSRAPFSTVASFSAHVRAISAPSARATTSTVIRASTAYCRSMSLSTVSASPSTSASARKPTCPRLTPSSGVPAGRANSAARSRDPSPPKTITSSAPSAASGPGATTVIPGQAMRSALGFGDAHGDPGGAEPADDQPCAIECLLPPGMHHDEHRSL